MLLISKIAEVTASQVLSRHHNFSIAKIITDSRQTIDVGQEALFVALRGEHFNGNRFVNDAYNKGLRNFIIDEAIDITPYPETNILLVPDTTAALQKIAAYHRQQFKIPVIGITGSNGKTMVKEWLSVLLHEEFNFVKSPGSYNSQVGVPLSVWQLGSEHTIGVFEAGISKPGEMDLLEKIIAPTIGVFTTLGDAHSEGFSSPEIKLKEKFELFKNCKTVILNHRYKALLAPDQKAYTWSRNDESANLYIRNVESANGYSIISYDFNSVDFKVSIPFTDDASIENAITCLCVCLLLNISNSDIAKNMQQLQAVEMRLSLQRGNHNNVIINDAYNTDLNSLKNALGFMNKQLHLGSKVVVLSDILQSGKTPEILYQEIGAFLNLFEITKLIGIGPEISKHKDAFNIPSVFYNTTADFIKDLNTKSVEFKESLILLKGARTFHFEAIAQALSAQHHTTLLEINLNAIAHNFHAYKKCVNENTKVMVMVKAFSYGSGSNEIASLLQFHKADYLAVAYADEGVQLRNAGVTLPIMVMNTEAQTFDLLFQYHLEPALYSFQQLHQLIDFATQPIGVHLEFETGMHRLGFEPGDAELLINTVNQNPLLQIKSVFSHLASAEDPNDDEFTLKQIDTFKHVSEKISTAFPSVLKHLLNSPGIARWASTAQFDMVRLGIGLYGIDPANQMNNQLIPASTLKSIISQIKTLQPGESVSYNRRFIASQNIRVATIPLGYADGLNRALGNGNGCFHIHGKPAKILGTICMDMTMVDITDIPCKEGDEVIVFGSTLPVTTVANQANTISYEILSTLSQRIKRVYLHE